MFSNKLKIPIGLLVFVTLGCSSDRSSQNAGLDSLNEAAITDGSTAKQGAPLESFSPKLNNNNFRISLTDAPSKDLSEVIVNISSIELWLEKGGKAARLIIGQNLGQVDLMKLRNGILLPVQDVYIPPGVSVTQLRLVLHGEGNYGVKTDESMCDLQTPSAQQNGVKIKLAQNVMLEDGYSYSLVIDFDAEKSVVIKGNQDCLLKPVIKVAGFTRVDQEDIDENGNSNNPGEEVNTPDDDTSSNENDNTDTGNDDTGFDILDPDTWPPGFEPDGIVSYFA